MYFARHIYSIPLYVLFIPVDVKLYMELLISCIVMIHYFYDPNHI